MPALKDMPEPVCNDSAPENEHDELHHPERLSHASERKLLFLLLLAVAAFAQAARIN